MTEGLVGRRPPGALSTRAARLDPRSRTSSGRPTTDMDTRTAIPTTTKRFPRLTREVVVAPGRDLDASPSVDEPSGATPAESRP
jgi:hypothetical protein